MDGVTAPRHRPVQRHTADLPRERALELLLGARVPTDAARRWRTTPRRIPDGDVPLPPRR